MANMPDINKTQVSMQLTVEDDQRLKRLARQYGSSKASIATSILHNGLHFVELNENDYREIATIVEARKRARGLQ